MKINVDKISFNQAKKEESKLISVLFKTVYIEAYAEEGITSELVNYMEKRFSEDHIYNIIKEKPQQLIIAYYGNNPIGVAEIHLDNICPIKNKSVVELDKLYVLRQFNSIGIGQGLMIETEKLIRKKAFKELNLEVFVGNNRAIKFYEEFGFVKIGKVDFPMQDNTYENWVMNKKLD